MTLMKEYWKGCLLLLVGAIPLGLFAFSFHPSMQADLLDAVLDMIEARSEPLPDKYSDLLPKYPETRGYRVNQLDYSTIIVSTAMATKEEVLRFYERELEARGWQQNPDEEPGEYGLAVIQGLYELSVHVFDDRVFPPNTSVIISISDDSQRYRPSRESHEAAIAILASVGDTYRECSSYHDTGSKTTHFLTNKGKKDWTSSKSFKTAFVRPDRFLLEITEDDDKTFGAVHVIHANASGVREWGNCCSSGIVTHQTLPDALTGTYCVPHLLTHGEDGWPLNLQELERPEEERMNGVEAYKIRGTDTSGNETVLWIDKAQRVIIQMELERQHRDFSTKSVTIWNPQINIPIPESSLAFKPFGNIPLPIGVMITHIANAWRGTPVMIQLIGLSCGALILAGLLHLRKTYRQRKACV